MPTLRYKLFEGLLRLGRANKLIGKVVDGGKSRRLKVPPRLKSRIETTDVAGHRVWIVHPAAGAGDKAYVHFHGGGYVLGLMRFHFDLAAQLSERSGLSVLLPEYPLAPAAIVEEITEFANASFNYAVDRWGGGQVKIGGGSAGGNLALALALYRRERKLPQPPHILLLSPWVDLEMSHPANDGPSEEICFSNATDLRRAALAYAGDIAVTDPRVSPTFADLSGLPPLSIFSGAVDLLHTDILTFADKAKAAGCLSKLATFGEMGHIFTHYPTPDRESALVEMGEILRR